jgi:serine O-acetyltransferase
MGLSKFFNQVFWALFAYRISHFLYVQNYRPIANLIWLISRWITNIDICPSAKIGKEIKIYHAFGIVIGQKVRIGDRVTILQQVTVGASHLLDTFTENDVPTIENDVVLGAGSKILGGITVGKNSIIGANAVVLKDIPANSIAVGVPAKIKPAKNRDILLYQN